MYVQTLITEFHYEMYTLCTNFIIAIFPKPHKIRFVSTIYIYLTVYMYNLV